MKRALIKAQQTVYAVYQLNITQTYIHRHTIYLQKKDEDNSPKFCFHHWVSTIEEILFPSFYTNSIYVIYITFNRLRYKTKKACFEISVNED